MSLGPGRDRTWQTAPPDKAAEDQPGKKLDRLVLGLGRRLLRIRMPVWLALLLVVAVAAAAAAVFVSRSVNLGRAVDGAMDVQASVTICNETVDRRDINPRQAELDFENGLRELGAEAAKLRVDRIDCGESALALGARNARGVLLG